MDETDFNVSRERYNAFVQQVQAEAASFNIEHRIEPTHCDGGSINGSFQVFWDRWRELGYEWDAMTPEARRAIFPERWEEIKCRAAEALMSS